VKRRNLCFGLRHRSRQPGCPHRIQVVRRSVGDGTEVRAVRTHERAVDHYRVPCSPALSRLVKHSILRSLAELLISTPVQHRQCPYRLHLTISRAASGITARVAPWRWVRAATETGEDREAAGGMGRERWSGRKSTGSSDRPGRRTFRRDRPERQGDRMGALGSVTVAEESDRRAGAGENEAGDDRSTRRHLSARAQDEAVRVAPAGTGRASETGKVSWHRRMLECQRFRDR